MMESSSEQLAFNYFAHVKRKEKKEKKGKKGRKGRKEGRERGRKGETSMLYSRLSLTNYPCVPIYFPMSLAAGLRLTGSEMDFSRSYMYPFQAKTGRARVHPHPLFPPFPFCSKPDRTGCDSGARLEATCSPEWRFSTDSALEYYLPPGGSV